MLKPILNKIIVKDKKADVDVKNPRPVLVPIAKNVQSKNPMTLKGPVINASLFHPHQDVKDSFEVFPDESNESQESSLCSNEMPTLDSSTMPWKKRKISSEDMADSTNNSFCQEVTSCIPPEFPSCDAKEVNILYKIVGYGRDIYKYQCDRERKKVGRPRLGYMDKQKELSVGMRAMLVDWFVDICREFKLCHSTFFLAISVVDRVLSFVDMPRAKFQLLGATSILVAAKMEEVYPLQLSDIVYVTEEAYEEAQILRMEKVVLHVVDFDLSVPTVETFASLFVFFQPISPEAKSLMWYLLELSAMHYEFLPFKQSHLAAAAYALGVCATTTSNCFEETTVGETIHENNLSIGCIVSAVNMSSHSMAAGKSKCPKVLLIGWSQELVDKTGVFHIDIVDSVSALAHLHRIAGQSENKAVFLKYSSDEHHHVSSNVQIPRGV